MQRPQLPQLSLHVTSCNLFPLLSKAGSCQNSARITEDLPLLPGGDLEEDFPNTFGFFLSAICTAVRMFFLKCGHDLSSGLRLSGSPIAIHHWPGPEPLFQIHPWNTSHLPEIQVLPASGPLHILYLLLGAPGRSLFLL